MEYHHIIDRTLKMRATRDFLASLVIHFGVFFCSAWLALRPLFLPWLVAVGACAATVVIVGFFEGRSRVLAVRPFYWGLLASIMAALLLVTIFDVAAASPHAHLRVGVVLRLVVDSLISASALGVLALSTVFALVFSRLGFLVGHQAAGGGPA